MKYQKIVVDISQDKVGLLADLVLDMGILGFEMVDDLPVDNPFDFDYEELKPNLPDRKGMASLIFYLEENEDPSSYIEKIKEEFKESKVSVSLSDESDWRDKWKEYFHSFIIGDILIKPSWEEVDSENAKTVIEIDPGISFGTGAHETTRMCIAQMADTDLKGKRVMDAGCGSGILSIAANKLGAGEITCVDIDPDCISTTKENLLKNNCDLEDFTFFTGDIMSNKALYNAIEDESFDVVVANILADIIITMLPSLYPKIKKGGTLITSGIISGKEESVQKAFLSLGFKNIETKKDGEWFMVRGEK